MSGEGALPYVFFENFRFRSLPGFADSAEGSVISRMRLLLRVVFEFDFLDELLNLSTV